MEPLDLLNGLAYIANNSDLRYELYEIIGEEWDKNNQITPHLFLPEKNTSHLRQNFNIYLIQELKSFVGSSCILLCYHWTLFPLFLKNLNKIFLAVLMLRLG